MNSYHLLVDIGMTHKGKKFEINESEPSSWEMSQEDSDAFHLGARKFKRAFVGFCRGERTRTREETQKILSELGVSDIETAMDWLDDVSRRNHSFLYNGASRDMTFLFYEGNEGRRYTVRTMARSALTD